MRFHLLTILLSLAFPALAIEKCLTEDGRTLYSDTPCPAGAKRVGGVQSAPPDPDASLRAREERERLLDDLDRVERKEALERQARAREADAAREEAREEARRAEQAALQKRQTEALEKLARERQENPPIYVAPQPVYVYPPHHPHPPRVKPRPQEEEKRYEMAPFPQKRQN